ncbi:MAG: hypothetical protein KAR18_13080 [Spirochaetes bacterium]|nr:hypothetical protein [Spirochaetota bacterium]
MKLRNFSLLILVFLFLFPTFVSAQYFTGALGKRFKMEDIRSIILEDFETNDKEWTVSASRFTKEGFPQLKSGIEGIPAALTGAYPSAENKYIFGVRSIFTRKGYNKVWIYPSEEIVVPGRAMRLDAWVWGGNYYYNLEAHVRDYTGVVYKLPLGSLHFIGWRNLNIDIPKQIPQEMRYLPMEKPLTFVRFAIWTEPTERVDDFVIYFDHLKILTDVYKERFDGDILADTSRDIWSSNSETAGAE